MSTVRTDFKTFCISRDEGYMRYESMNNYHKPMGLCKASKELWEKAGYQGGVATYLSYSVYEGIFIEKCLVDYLIENNKDSIFYETNDYDGYNTFVFGNMGDQIWLFLNGKGDLDFYDDFKKFYNREFDRILNRELDIVFGMYKDNGRLESLSDEEKNSFRECFYKFLKSFGVPTTSGIDYDMSLFNDYGKEHLGARIMKKIKWK